MVSEGDRVKLVRTSDELTELEPGDEGTVTEVTSWPVGIGLKKQKTWVDWDNGEHLAMLEHEDEIEVIDDD